MLTNRCILAPLKEADFNAVAEIYANETARQYLGGAIPANKTIDRLQEATADENSYDFTVHLHKTSELLGMVSVSPHHEPGDMEVSYIFHPKYWGNGYARESVLALLDFCKNELKLKRIVSETQTANISSCRLLEGLGYKVECRLERFGAMQTLYFYDFPAQESGRAISQHKIKPQMVTESNRLQIGANKMQKIQIHDVVKEEAGVIARGLSAYNNSQVPFTQEPPFSAVRKCIKDGDEVVAGILAETYCWNILYIDILWVKEEYRHMGYGSALLKEVEEQAKEMGCKLVHLDTFDFQAKGLYEKLGYTVFGTLEDCPEGHNRYYLSKKL